MALQCARLQQRLSLPPLEVDDFPHFTLNENFQGSDINEVDALQEILSVASASQELINNSSCADLNWAACMNPHLDEFTALLGLDKGNETICSKLSDIGEEPTKLIEIRDLEEEFKEGKREVENLRGIKTFHCASTEVYLQEKNLFLIQVFLLINSHYSL